MEWMGLDKAKNSTGPAHGDPRVPEMHRGTNPHIGTPAKHTKHGLPTNIALNGDIFFWLEQNMPNQLMFNMTQH